MNPTVYEWTSLLLRWMHIFTGILWIGSTWYFTWLDFRVREAVARSEKTGEPAVVWMVHSGGFYKVEKLTKPDVSPDRLHWFKWETLITLINGLLLLVLVYWMGGALVDSDVSKITEQQAMALGVALFVGGWFIYDFLYLKLLSKNEYAGAAVGYLLVLAVAWGLLHTLAPRAAYIHLGALFGTLMTLNVWVRILPAQRALVATLGKPDLPDQQLADRAKYRSKHNTFLVVPLIFTMISNHFPIATYGNDHAFAVLAAMVAGGWLVAWRIRGYV